VPEVPEELDDFVSDGYITDVLGKIKEGKEAEVYLCAADPRLGERFLAAKVHREVARRRFRDDGIYREGRVIGSRTVRKAIEKRSAFGQEMMGATWLAYEYDNLRDMEEAGVPVPHVWAHAEHALLLSFIGSDEGEAAPPLFTLRPGKEEAWALYRQVERALTLALGAHRIHADLSPYNILVAEGTAYLIDWPQGVDPRKNPNARALLDRDVRNVLQYFGRYGVTVDPRAVADRLWQRWERGEL